jgi:TolB protein
MFTREASNNRGSQIVSVDVTGRNERRVLTPGSASDPAWSPLIQ